MLSTCFILARSLYEKCTAVTKIILLRVLLAPSSPLLGGAADCLFLLLPKHSVETLSTYCSIDFRMI